jgi:hypothetical protein
MAATYSLSKNVSRLFAWWAVACRAVSWVVFLFMTAVKARFCGPLHCASSRVSCHPVLLLVTMIRAQARDFSLSLFKSRARGRSGSECGYLKAAARPGPSPRPDSFIVGSIFRSQWPLILCESLEREKLGSRNDYCPQSKSLQGR